MYASEHSSHPYFNHERRFNGRLSLPGRAPSYEIEASLLLDRSGKLQAECGVPATVFRDGLGKITIATSCPLDRIPWAEESFQTGTRYSNEPPSRYKRLRYGEREDLILPDQKYANSRDAMISTVHVPLNESSHRTTFYVPVPQVKATLNRSSAMPSHNGATDWFHNEPTSYGSQKKSNEAPVKADVLEIATIARGLTGKPIVGQEFLKSFKCPVCKKIFDSRYGLRRHIRSHTGERPYTCDWCGRKFRQGTHLSGHINSRHLMIPSKRRKRTSSGALKEAKQNNTVEERKNQSKEEQDVLKLEDSVNNQ
eukprot:CAMPEP_0184502138 /NCGR_PEP_ID=MMETSP0113_2-20130426/49437_1 /TAXON_ID=91329 /ORGANISM="Norrisiella sphaerica, Strain BC52" /LENGTH=309 /DNA_ID=CAMNT_0026891153 /DNA_START=254 /DNA_END=1183 /DNA_ORIENTATION=+